MRETMLQMMQKMGPFMGPMFWTGVVFLGIGAVFLLARFLNANTGKAVSWSSSIVIILGLFFVVAHFMGTYLGMDTPFIAFGDVATFDIIKGDFWMLGAGLFVSAVFLKILLKMKGSVAV
ncbi:hypothetical protein MNBD_GAMMA12-3878 [hydrothermal vent metagenome]|uniref:Uncharacterized protein n=1 Tax=hydrothermal vent metagenome TaxID=652676 RepID=A0A3B0YPK3_9ZZZZ